MKSWHPINWIQWLTLALALFMAFAFVILYVRIEGVQAHENDALHSIICFAEQRVQTSPIATVQQKRQAVRFYNQALADANLKPCPQEAK